MAFGGGKKQGGNLAEINVTPLVDVMLVLLIIFMVTAPMLQQEMDVNLPVASGTPKEVADEQLILTITKKGEVFLNRTLYTIDTLEAKLQALGQAKPNQALFLRADADVPYGTVVRVMDAVKQAGILKLGMITQPSIEKP